MRADVPKRTDESESTLYYEVLVIEYYFAYS